MSACKVVLIVSLLLLCICLNGIAETQVMLPDGYDSDRLRYPVLYLLPSSENETASGLADIFRKTDGQNTVRMILVCPEFGSNENPQESLNRCIAETDAAYRTIPEPAYRFLAGAGGGGYLSYALGLMEPEAFGGIASIAGDFAGAGHPWLSEFGSVYDRIESIQTDTPGVFEQLYTYLDAPVDDPGTDVPGSTDDIGKRFIVYRIPSSFHEFTVRPGQMSESFLAESAERILNRFGACLLSKAVSGTVSLSRSAAFPGESVTAECSLLCTDEILRYSDAPSGVLILAIQDQDGSTIRSYRQPVDAILSGETEWSCPLDGLPAPASLTVSLSLEAFSGSFLLDTAVLAMNVKDDDNPDHLALDGDWHFTYTGSHALDMAALTEAEFGLWPTVQPGLGSWTKGYGNISDDNVDASYGAEYFDFFITGNGYYARTFQLPDNFHTDDCILSIGYVDDRCEVWLNGRRVGETGMKDGRSSGETAWAQYSAFTLSPSDLKKGKNTLIVRCFNDPPYGAGGWYNGPTALYSASAFAALADDTDDPRFFEITFPSSYAAKATLQTPPVSVSCLIYLPEGYDTSLRRYPTVYMLHQFNSDHTSYRRDHVKEMMDAGIQSGAFDEMIVVIPNSSEDSWWRDHWEKMVTEELVPYLDQNYRTIRDSRWRLTAGCSMGGQGAYGIALQNPDLFSGAISFFGAFSYGAAASPNAIVSHESAEYLRYFALYFICGNQDSYGFGVPAIQLHQSLLEKSVPHRFFIENGGHDSAFYTPYFEEAFAYVRSQMMHTGILPNNIISGRICSDETYTIKVDASDALSSLLPSIPDSSYTNNPSPLLQADILLTLTDDDTVTCLMDEAVTLIPGSSISLPLPGDLSLSSGTLTLHAALFDQVITLDSLTIR
ncbi:MAG: hypothetical protein IJ242_04250 [Clostridia bacterium]|nr:hypothetical protein [Clostridia bacterium]